MESPVMLFLGKLFRLSFMKMHSHLNCLKRELLPKMAASTDSMATDSASDGEKPTIDEFAFPDAVIAESKRIQESVDYSKLVTNTEGRYSTILPFFTAQAVQIIRKHFSVVDQVYDATANIGGDSINIAFNFPRAKVTAVEVNGSNAKILRRNVAAVGLEKQITCVEANCVADIEKRAEKYDFVYFDPPWGGTDIWKTEKALMLKLSGADTDEPPLEVPIYEVVKRVFALNLSRAVVLKAPPNFDLAALEEALRAEHECTVATEVVRKRRRGRDRGEIAYYVHVIKDTAAASAAASESASESASAASSAASASGQANVAPPGVFATLGAWTMSPNRRERGGASFVLRRLRMFLGKRLETTPRVLQRVLAFIEECSCEKIGDGEILSRLAKFCKPMRSVKQEGRAAARITDVSSILRDLLADKPAVENYLDIGCAEGGLTVAFGEALGLDASHIFGCDVVPVATNAQFEFAIAQAEELPYEDGQFQVISFIMSLHHIKDVPAALAEAQRVLAPGGLLIVREHDSRSKHFALFLDLVHYLYATVLGDEVELRVGHENEDFEARRECLESSYKSQAAWTKAIEGGGFDFVRAVQPMVGRTRGSDMFNSYYAFFRK